MHSTLTPSAAKELGRVLGLMRTTQRKTLRDVARSATMASQYAHNIERGDKLTVSEDFYARFARAVCIPDDAWRDHILRARVRSALEQHGLSPDQVEFVWTGVVQRLAEQGIVLRLDLAKLIADIFEGPPCD